MIAVVDCNNFFVSCELVFHPRLRGKPVVVASNNDGCIVSRSAEAKQLGIPMAAPAFKWRDLFARNNVTVFSGNFPLYGDMSRRVMDILYDAAPDVEMYSIDEAFLDLGNLYRNREEELSRSLREKIFRFTGIPVSIGIGETKTLAKAAVELAKKNPKFGGVASTAWPDFEDLLATLPVKDVWGIGRKLSEVMRRQGIFTARDLKYAPDGWVQQRAHIPGLRTVYELRGIPCVSMQTEHVARKGIIASRSFGTLTAELSQLSEAVALHATRAGERLRSDASVASYLQVYITTNYFRQDQKQYSSVAGYRLEQPTAYAPALITAAHKALASIYRPGFLYKKAMVMLGGIMPENQIQLSLFNSYHEKPRERELMRTIDSVNRRLGRTRLHYAACGITRKKEWHPKQEHLSKRFTTSWHELPLVKSG